MKKDIFEDLRFIVGCNYISDLRSTKYNEIARSSFYDLELQNYTEKQIKDLLEYLNFPIRKTNM